MLQRTHSAFAPWHVLHVAEKKAARINLIRDILNRLHYDGKDERLIAPDAKVVFEFDEACLRDGRLAG